MLEAQQRPADCTYDTCAIRVEGDRLLRGTGSTVAGRLGLWSGPRLSELLSGSDSVSFYARRFDQNYNIGQRLSFLGVALAVPVMLQWVPGERRTMSDAWLVGLGVPSIVFNITSTVKLRRARVALSRALWWYNRGLPK